MDDQGGTINPHPTPNPGQVGTWCANEVNPKVGVSSQLTDGFHLKISQ